MINSAVLMCGGLSVRYQKNKLLETFYGKTLMEYNVEFCLENQISKIHIVYYDEKVKQYLECVFTHLIEEHVVKLWKRPDHPVGTGASMLTPYEELTDRFIVLFGDNYYHGFLQDEKQDQNVATFLTLRKDIGNARFAAIRDNIIIEKPHEYMEGDFFAGYMIFQKESIDIKNIRPSTRGEIEITDIFNKTINRTFKEIDVMWQEITYLDDYEKMLHAIKRENIN